MYPCPLDGAYAHINILQKHLGDALVLQVVWANMQLDIIYRVQLPFLVHVAPELQIAQHCCNIMFGEIVENILDNVVLHAEPFLDVQKFFLNQSLFLQPRCWRNGFAGIC